MVQNFFIYRKEKGQFSNFIWKQIDAFLRCSVCNFLCSEVTEEKSGSCIPAWSLPKVALCTWEKRHYMQQGWSPALPALHNLPPTHYFWNGLVCQESFSRGAAAGSQWNERISGQKRRSALTACLQRQEQLLQLLLPRSPVITVMSLS